MSIYAEVGHILRLNKENTTSLVISQFGHNISSFLVTSVLASFVKSGKSVLFICLTENFEHYKLILQRQGIGLQPYVDSGKIKIISGLELLTSHDDSLSPVDTLVDNVQSFAASVEDAGIIVDDLSALLSLRVPFKEVVHFVEACYSLRKAFNNSLSLVFSVNVPPSDPEHRNSILSRFLCYRATNYVDVVPLEMGPSKRANGQLTCSWMGDNEINPEQECFLYKLEERKIYFYPVPLEKN